MHKVIFMQNEVPFKECRDVFNMSKSDNRHFQNLRAAFGVHPTDLNWIVKGEVKYSSWSVISHDERYDFVVWLYSSIPGKRAETYGFNVDELIRFVQMRYEHLVILIKELKKQAQAALCELKAKGICKTSSLVERISVLKEAAEERFGREDYYHALIDIETMLNAPCTFRENIAVINEYKQLLHVALDSIENNLQQMVFEELPSLDIVEPPFWTLEIGYDLEKVHAGIRGDDGLSYVMLPYHLERVAPYLKGIIKITPTLRTDELLLLVNAGLYFAGVDNKE